MKRLLFLVGLLTAAWAGPAYAADGIPPRPKPFTFVTDQAGLLQPAEVKRLDYGLRQYADNNGTQVVVVTVPSLGGQDVNAFTRQIGTDWGLGQKDKNNGLVVLVAKQEHKLSVEAGSGLRERVTPSVIQQAIGKMTPQFKQNNYGQGLQNGLNVLLAAANPGSAPKSTASSTAAPATSGAIANSSSLGTTTSPSAAQAMGDPAGATQSSGASDMSGSSLVKDVGIGSILLIVVVIGGGIWLLSRLFRRNTNAAGNNPGGSPNFYPNQPTQGGSPNFYPNQAPGYGAPAQSGGSGMGGLLATGAAAAAGAYLGNRLGGSHDSNDSGRNFSNDNLGNNAGAAAGAAGGTAAADDYFASRGGAEESNAGPDYFSNSGDDSSGGDYFSGNDNSYDDSSGGGGFDDTNNDNSGSW